MLERIKTIRTVKAIKQALIDNSDILEYQVRCIISLYRKEHTEKRNVLDDISYNVWMYPNKYAEYIELINVAKFEQLNDTLKNLVYFKSLKNNEQYDNEIFCYDETTVWLMDEKYLKYFV